MQVGQPKELVLVLTKNFFRSYRGRSQEYVAVVKMEGGNDTQNVFNTGSLIDWLTWKPTAAASPTAFVLCSWWLKASLIMVVAAAL